MREDTFHFQREKGITGTRFSLPLAPPPRKLINRKIATPSSDFAACVAAQSAISTAFRRRCAYRR